MASDYKTLRVIDEGPLLRVELNRPETGNAISGEVLGELLDVLTALEDDGTVRVMVLSGAGDHFCQGGDRSEFPALLAEDPSGAALRALAHRAQRVCEALSRLGVVTIARLQGDVIGAGLGLAVFCDLRVGADTCRFRMPEVGLGVPPAWGGVLPRLVEEAGQARVRRLLLTAEQFDAATAESLSLLHEVVPPDGLDAAVTRWVKPMLRRDPTTLRITKTMLNARANAAQLSVGSYFDAELLTSAATRRELTRKR
ncbi:enoyl-CoA hydratase/isomerase family protein [Streptomyces tropicalis]|uniref:Enoyl-CoA hydratase/isomerase family protein n=1 Tax=Streptomyces tropicalis TaxID=3034234 RepID=A0ABT6A1H4_9ACTN|nr:enoyl-CoA hydratase/isomerase family protein [Streptomyces tropicalis]MDF3298496.1 enoyl-CoA hydratase/isomerase family protein [Streptomyces tropicalis]